MGITCQILLSIVVLVIIWIITDVVAYANGFEDGYNKALLEDTYVSNDL